LKKVIMNLIFSKMTLSDLKEIEDILYTDFDEFWNLQIFKQELANNNSYYIVARLDNEIVGFGGIWQAIDIMHVTNIVTKKNKRNQKIGSKILEELIKISKKKQAISITLEVNEKNIPAIRLYEKYNFKKVGLRKKYYNNIDNAIIMTLDLL